MKCHCHNYVDRRVNMENNTRSDIVNRGMEGDSVSVQEKNI